MSTKPREDSNTLPEIAPPRLAQGAPSVFAPAFAPNYSPGGIAVLLGRSYSSVQMLEAQALLTYVKKHGIEHRPDLQFRDIRLLREAVHHSRLIEALNRGRKWALKRLSERLAPLLLDDLVIVVVPSHDPWLSQTPIRQLAQAIALLAHLTDGTDCLVRHTKINRIVFGGPSTSALHRETIQIQNADQFAGRRVLLLDDIAKSGRSLATCRALLQEAGAAFVQAAALGRVSGDVILDSLSSNPSQRPYSLDRSTSLGGTSMPSRVVIDNKQTPATNPVAGLEPIPGDTYPLRAELKALGAVWDAATRVWHIAPEKLPLATALVAHQALVPPKTLPTDANGEVIDPFEDEAKQPPIVTLGSQDGASYDHKDTLRAVGAHWDKAGRTWTIREERAEYARAVLKSVADAPAPPAVPSEKETAAEETADAALPPVREEAPARPRERRNVEPMPDTRAAELPEAHEDTEGRPSAKLMKLGGLWVSKGKNGRTFLSAKLTPNVRLLIFKNQFKTTDAQPDYEMYLAPVAQEGAAGKTSSESEDMF